MRARIWLAGAAVMAAGWTAALADTLKVPSDDYPDIQTAIDAAVEGDTILVGPGEYSQELYLQSRTGLTLKGVGGPVLAGVGIAANSSSDISISGFKVQNPANWGVRAQGCTDLVVSKMSFEGGAGDAIYLDGCAGVAISKCSVRNPGGNGIRDNSSDDVVVEKCSFEDSGQTAIGLSPYTNPGSDGAIVSKNRVTGASSGLQIGGVNVLVEKNQIAEVVTYGIYLDNSASMTGAVVTKNRIEGGNYGIFGYVSDSEISKNYVGTSAIAEIYVSGSAVTIEKNRTEAGQTGISTNGAGMTVSKNAVGGAQVGILMNSGDGCVVEKNKVTGTGSQGSGGIRIGIRISISGSTIGGNTAKSGWDLGFYVTGTANTFSKNKCTDSGTADLADSNAEGVNDYDATNKFDVIVYDLVL
jgi:parallel beta-helix repeat protein